ncbi:MAG: hypothetical protein IM613_12540 [Cytophagales bacterium]|jgi:hypothetical protein|nr:hypothetical protein [Cytophagales bacterium]
MHKQFYAGIGSRSTPSDILELMSKIAAALGKQNYVLRSGGAKGADTAFYNGAKQVNALYRIYLPSQYFNGFKANIQQGFMDSSQSPNWDKALKTVAKYHSAPEKLSTFAKALHARNVYQVLGATLDNPVAMVITWTPGGKITGGTGQALLIAKDYDIPVYNLALEGQRNKILDMLHNETL